MAPELLLFFGAGASKPLGIPTNRDLYQEFIASPSWDSLRNRDQFPALFDDIIKSCGIEPLDIEAVMSVLSALAAKDPQDALLRGGKPGALFSLAKQSSGLFGPGTQKHAQEFLDTIKAFVRERCQSYKEDSRRSNYDPIMDSFIGPHERWEIGRGDSRTQAYIAPFGGPGRRRVPSFSGFTTNYDTAFEDYLNDLEIQCESGFEKQGNRFCLSPSVIHGTYDLSLFKLHGSVDYIKHKDGKIVHIPFYQPGIKAADLKEVLIYPTQEKELFQFPFIDFFYEFVRALRQTRLWVFFGFSFSDIPILRLVLTEATPGKKVLIVSPDASKICANELASLGERTNLNPVEASIGVLNVKDKIIDAVTS